MQRALRLVAGVPILLGILGMGALGGGRDAAAPQEDVRARLVDVDGAQVEVTHLSVGGDTTLEGELGRGRLRVPFSRIERIELASESKDRDRMRATVTLREGAPVTLVLRSSTTFYGQLASGAYQVRARDLRSVEIGR
ncbi:MAG TPA: hypothetical protein VMS22_11470 [Candidatus Eisenbacteria bacterium]|nr:hypothetical protein [Candidatus Eisenbacteria bacterium]